MVSFSRELQRFIPVTHATISADNVHHLEPALSLPECQFWMSHDGTRSADKHVFNEVECYTSLFLNTFDHAQPLMAGRWLQAFIVRWNRI